MERYAEIAPAEAIASIRFRLPPGTFQVKRIFQLYVQWAQQDPDAATENLVSVELPPLRVKLIYATLSRVELEGKSQALLLASLPPAAMKLYLLTEVMAKSVTESYQAALELAPEFRALIMQRVLRRMYESSPQDAFRSIIALISDKSDAGYDLLLTEWCQLKPALLINELEKVDAELPRMKKDVMLCLVTHDPGRILALTTKMNPEQFSDYVINSARQMATQSNAMSWARSAITNPNASPSARSAIISTFLKEPFLVDPSEVEDWVENYISAATLKQLHYQRYVESTLSAQQFTDKFIEDASSDGLKLAILEHRSKFLAETDFQTAIEWLDEYRSLEGVQRLTLKILTQAMSRDMAPASDLIANSDDEFFSATMPYWVMYSFAQNQEDELDQWRDSLDSKRQSQLDMLKVAYLTRDYPERARAALESITDERVRDRAIIMMFFLAKSMNPDLKPADLDIELSPQVMTIFSMVADRTNVPNMLNVLNLNCVQVQIPKDPEHRQRRTS